MVMMFIKICQKYLGVNMYGKINVWWRKSRTKKEGKLTGLPELNDLFLKMLKKKASIPYVT